MTQYREVRVEYFEYITVPCDNDDDAKAAALDIARNDRDNFNVSVQRDWEEE